MSRLPRGKSLDLIVAAGLVVLGQVELWVGNVITGPKALVAPLVILITGSVAVRRRWPLMVVSVVTISVAAIAIVAGSPDAVAVGVAFFCALYGLAVWTDTRGFLTGCGVVFGSNALFQLGPHGSLSAGVIWTVVPGLAMLIARRAIRDRQLLAEALAARAELLERERDLRAHEAVAE